MGSNVIRKREPVSLCMHIIILFWNTLLSRKASLSQIIIRHAPGVAEESEIRGRLHEAEVIRGVGFEVQVGVI